MGEINNVFMRYVSSNRGGVTESTWMILLLVKRGKRTAQIGQLFVGVGEHLKEIIFVAGKLFRILFEDGIVTQFQVGREHHQLAALVLVLQGTVPLLLRPLVVQQLHEIVVAEHGGAVSPGTTVATAVEDGTDMVTALGSIRQAAIGRAKFVVRRIG